MNNPFTLAKSEASIADMICNYLDTRNDLEINCTMLDKLVLVSCVSAEGLKKEFVDQALVTKIKLKPDNPDSQKSYAEKYTALSKPWNEKRQEALNKSVLDYESKGEEYFNAKADKAMVMPNPSGLFAVFDRDQPGPPRTRQKLGLRSTCRRQAQADHRAHLQP